MRSRESNADRQLLIINAPTGELERGWSFWIKKRIYFFFNLKMIQWFNFQVVGGDDIKYDENSELCS